MSKLCYESKLYPDARFPKAPANAIRRIAVDYNSAIVCKIEQNLRMWDSCTISSKNADTTHNGHITVLRIYVFLFNAVVIIYFLNAQLKRGEHLSFNKKDIIRLLIIKNDIWKVKMRTDAML